MNRFLYGLLLLSNASLFAQSPKKNPTPLTVETIMQDPKIWVGTSPSAPFWSDDSQTLYFNWNPDQAKGDSLYKVTLNPAAGRSGRASQLAASSPQKVGPAERRSLATPPVSAFNRTYTQRLFDRQGICFYSMLGLATFAS